MKTQIKHLLLMALVISSLTACKKESDDNDDTQNSGLPGQLHKITSSGNDLIIYSYDGTGKLTQEEIHNGNQTMTITYTYDNGKISNETGKYNGSTAYQYTYTYQNNKLDKCNIVGATQSYWQMHYDNGKIDYATQYIGGGESKKMTYTYTGDNITEAQLLNRFGGTWELEKRYEFEYDNKHNPLHDLNVPFSEVISEFANLVSPNNSTRIKEFDQNNLLVNDDQYQMTYNADNYPTTTTENNTTTYEFIYY